MGRSNVLSPAPSTLAQLSIFTPRLTLPDTHVGLSLGNRLLARVADAPAFTAHSCSVTALFSIEQIFGSQLKLNQSECYDDRNNC
jgi:hypothetical protein